MPAPIEVPRSQTLAQQQEQAERSADGDDRKREAGMAGVFVLSILAALFIFKAVPHLLTWLLGKAVGPSLDTKGVWFHVVDGVMRLVVLVGYIWAISKTKDGNFKQVEVLANRFGKNTGIVPAYYSQDSFDIWRWEELGE